MHRVRSLLALCALLAGCRTQRTSAPPGLEEAVIVPLPAQRAWVVEEDGQVVGSVVRYEEPMAGRRACFAVRNALHQDLGTIDEKGRSWRLRPHRDPEWLGTGRLIDGVRMILGAGGGVALREVPLDTLAPPAPRAAGD